MAYNCKLVEIETNAKSDHLQNIYLSTPNPGNRIYIWRFAAKQSENELQLNENRVQV